MVLYKKLRLNSSGGKAVFFGKMLTKKVFIIWCFNDAYLRFMKITNCPFATFLPLCWQFKLNIMQVWVHHEIAVIIVLSMVYDVF